MLVKPRLAVPLICLVVCLALASCASLPPSNRDNLCAVFVEQDGWYPDAQKAAQKWGIPVAVIMAIMHQESRFVADAKPPRTWLLGIVPWFRPSSAYGYAQAKDETWDVYLHKAGSWWSDRDDFADAADFIGWYCHISHAKLGIVANDAKNLYLAYHEGHRGFQQKTHVRSVWLRRVADKVALRARYFQKQLSECKMTASNQ
ncbi:MAG: transglycosylase SLT domain-containing protein [Methylovulum sp.]|uniref:transglycosylase SLT domain-containing protein n=1 Tax=Methylovulum sp. TaxID=1916980 RepID=UPI00260CCE1E|nr:transglycosylase SLT domain-containing protein [Methylovulum sp.]MDD2723735.1 transglycosylase SLT domain-containing protein [Methylovulum sp.]MDD5125352.1 transglycosylase SLT domain-containing protein [Methylovulum sp.]